MKTTETTTNEISLKIKVRKVAVIVENFENESWRYTLLVCLGLLLAPILPIVQKLKGKTIELK